MIRDEFFSFEDDVHATTAVRSKSARHVMVAIEGAEGVNSPPAEHAADPLSPPPSPPESTSIDIPVAPSVSRAESLGAGVLDATARARVCRPAAAAGPATAAPAFIAAPAPGGCAAAQWDTAAANGVPTAAAPVATSAPSDAVETGTASASATAGGVATHATASPRPAPAVNAASSEGGSDHHNSSPPQPPVAGSARASEPEATTMPAARGHRRSSSHPVSASALRAQRAAADPIAPFSQPSGAGIRPCTPCTRGSGANAPAAAAGTAPEPSTAEPSTSLEVSDP
eukprot:1742469-Prymnesium_polylepis.2